MDHGIGTSRRTRSRQTDARRQEVFSQMFAEHYSTIVRYAQRRVESREIAEDIAAETFAVAWDKLDVRAPFTLRWLYRTASNKVMNHWSRNRSRREVERHIAHDAEKAGRETDTLEILAVREALLALPTRQAEALRLTAWEGLSASEAAEVLDCRVGSVHKLVSRGRARLRELLSPGVALRPRPLRRGEVLMIRIDDDLDRLLRAADPLGHESSSPASDSSFPLPPAALEVRDRIMARRPRGTRTTRLSRAGIGAALTVALIGGGSAALAANGLQTPWGWIADNVFHVDDGGGRDCFNGIQIGSGGLGEESQLRKDAIQILRDLDISSLDTSEWEERIRQSREAASATSDPQDAFWSTDAGIKQRALWIVTSQAVWDGLRAKGYSPQEIGLIDLTGRSSCY